MMTDKKALEEFALSCFHNDSYGPNTKTFHDTYDVTQMEEDRQRTNDT